MNFMNRKQFRGIALLTLSFGAFLLLLAGCDQGGGITVPSGATNLSVSVKNTNINNPGSVLVITEAKALISNVKFEVDGSGGTNEQIPVNPFVVNFNLDGSLKEMTSGYIIRNNYANIKFELHKPESAETLTDPEFNTGPLDNQRFSFIIKGKYNGVSFVHRSIVTADIVIGFASVENINLADMNISVLFNVPDWFMSGTTVMDPSDPQNETMIDNNIKSSFKQAFIDNDKNGNPDN